MGKIHKYTSEQLLFLKENVKGNSWQKITELFNKKFNLNISVTRIKALGKRHSFKNNVCMQFKNGRTPFNKGKKGLNGVSSCWFKQGDVPWNICKVGTEREINGGYLEVKVASPNKWAFKQRLVWEEHYGQLNKGDIILFADQNKRNFNIDNLIKINNDELLYLNRNSLIFEDKDLTKVGVNISHVALKIRERAGKK